ncbi:MAG: Phosphoribosylamine--glycine ligase [Clostridiales bacterium 38_11]|nr:MAG: Phosphoribosylamine--glycine ligase [Clostridiales bacterium 38_11]HBH12773.1 phosphoribosylamine--glycine ligase [Clostridiales bacterium]
MRVLVVGNGGREHAICWKISQSPLVEELYCIPGNAGIQEIAECVEFSVDDIQGITDFAKDNSIDLTIIGPEVPLVLGLADSLKEVGLKVFGPDKKAAKFEGSKAYSKDFMVKYNIPTAQYGVFSNADDALRALKQFDIPIVVKADGLAAGKGVLICERKSEAEEAIVEIMQKHQFGEAGNRIVIEEFLTGTEASLLCFVDGTNIIPMESARDYKKAYDGDKGLNTGGMGCFSPNPIYTDRLKNYIDNHIISNIKVGLQKESIDFRGVLFIGLMIEDDEAKVLEFNVRFGDPETQVILPRLESDLIEIMMKVIEGNLHESDLVWSEKQAVAVVIASGGYPNDYKKGKVINGLNTMDDDIMIFHAGTILKDGNVVTNGGRVMAVTCMEENVEKARDKIYNNIGRIIFDKMEYRTDIAKL